MGHTGYRLDGRVCKCMDCARMREKQRIADRRTQEQREALAAAREQPRASVEYQAGLSLSQAPVRVWRRDDTGGVVPCTFFDTPGLLSGIRSTPMFLNPGEAVAFIGKYAATQPNDETQYVLLDATIPVA